jgi:ubiquinone/menaquinone biosynthesis C-methylase UbiE
MNAIEQKTAVLYEDIHPFNDLEYTINLYLSTLGIREDFFKDKKVIDCGFGGTAWGLHLFARAKARLVAGIDLNEHWVSKAKKEIQKYQTPNDLRQGSLLKIPFEDNSFDYAHSFGVIHHTIDWKKSIDEMVRVLKPGGTLSFMVYGSYAPVGWAIQKMYRLAGKIVPYKVMAGFVKTTGFFRSPEISILDGMYVPIELHFTEKQLNDHLSSLGLKNITFFKSTKWDNRPVYRTIFGSKINHNVWATKP